jgi:hypothetical protein
MATLITLTTDFGTADGFVGAMKGVILSLAPHATIVDVSHDIPPQDIRAGTFALETALSHFPPDTIHVVVVDPGVGSARAALLVATEQGRFIGPDNGVLTGVATETHTTSIYALDRPNFWLPQVSATFHGRDVFAPAAAHLAKGALPQELGSLRSDMVRLPWPQPVKSSDGIAGEVIHVDRFGNLITNLRLEDLDSDHQHARIRVGDTAIAGITPHYAAGKGIIVVPNSGGRLEIALPNASAAKALRMGIGEKVRVLPP